MQSKQYPFRCAPILLAVALLSGMAVRAQSTGPGADDDDADFPVVITPTRLRQSLADVPASVTVITAETLRRYGITRVEEALRMVPGMAVSQAVGNDFRINYHGTSAVAPRRLNVLVDGVSAYLPAFSQVQWNLLPVALEDIDRIEVIRGPDSSAYGPNSMTAVVNILTKHPMDVERGLLVVTAGAHGTLNSTVRLATTVGSTSVRATVSTQGNTGYDRINAAGGSSDDTHIARLNLRALHELSDGSSLDVQASFSGGDLEDGVGDPNQASLPNRQLRSGQVSARLTKSLSAFHELQVDVSHVANSTRERWTSCWPQVAFWPEVSELFQSNPGLLFALQRPQFQLPPGVSARDRQLVIQILTRLAQMGGLPSLAQNISCGQINRDGSESRTQLELQDTYVASDKLRFVGGLGVRQQRADSPTYFGGAVSNSVQWLFGHAEYRPADWLIANVGGYGEFNSLSGSTFSPRLALNVRLTENQTLRAVVSKGTRSPDLFEERANWSYTLTDLSVPVNGSTTGRLFNAARAKGGLSSEQIWSRELGYLLIDRPLGLTLDARIFDDRLSRLISKRLTTIDFAPDNTGSVRLTGAELQARWDPSARWSTWLSYAYLLNRAASHIEETSQYSRHSGAVGVSVALSSAWRASVAHYASTGDGVYQRRYGRTDLTLQHQFLCGAQPGSISLTLGYLHTPSVNTYVDTQQFYTSTYDRQLSLLGQFRVAF